MDCQAVTVGLVMARPKFTGISRVFYRLQNRQKQPMRPRYSHILTGKKIELLIRKNLAIT